MALITLRLTRRQVEFLVSLYGGEQPDNVTNQVSAEARKALTRYNERLAAARAMVNAAHEENENE